MSHLSELRSRLQNVHRELLEPETLLIQAGIHCHMDVKSIRTLSVVSREFANMIKGLRKTCWGRYTGSIKKFSFNGLKAMFARALSLHRNMMFFDVVSSRLFPSNRSELPRHIERRDEGFRYEFSTQGFADNNESNELVEMVIVTGIDFDERTRRCTFYHALFEGSEANRIAAGFNDDCWNRLKMHAISYQELKMDMQSGELFSAFGDYTTDMRGTLRPHDETRHEQFMDAIKQMRIVTPTEGLTVFTSFISTIDPLYMDGEFIRLNCSGNCR